MTELIRSSTPKWLIAAVAPAPVVLAGAATTPSGHAGVQRASGTAAIQRAAARVKRMTHASSYRLSECSTGGSGVTCLVRWRYTGFGCSAKMRGRSADGAVKVKRASPIHCQNLD
jgi:hypothetical protein